MFHVQTGADMQEAQTDKTVVWSIPPTDYITVRKSVRNENLIFKETDLSLESSTATPGVCEALLHPYFTSIS